jgi:hypothetical protein
MWSQSEWGDFLLKRLTLKSESAISLKSSNLIQKMKPSAKLIDVCYVERLFA